MIGVLAVPGCDGDECGDGTCTGAESCASCALDCSPIGIGACGGACNPTATPTGCAANFACVPAVTGGAGACVGQAVACDAKAQTGCALGESCLPLAGAGVGGEALLCAPSGPRGAGEACGSQRDCGAKLLCSSGVCRAACDPASASCAGAIGGVCRDVSREFGLAGGSLGPCDTACGDGTCGGGETCGSCAGDCGACDVCGDTVCGSTESCDGCALDCGLCRACGNAVCQSGETCLDCPADCGACAVCGDGVCALSETCESCESDCGSCGGTCGDAVCSLAENCTTCGGGDCGACPVWSCGNGVCEPGEDCAVCASDCGECGATCGNGQCERGESCVACADCALLPGVSCGSACDPLAQSSGCGTNQACVPTAEGHLFRAPLDEGNGVCGVGCASDAECGAGRCLPLHGLDVAGVCGAACVPGAVGVNGAGGCVDGATCVPSPADPDLGVCVAGGVCSPFGGTCADGDTCVSVQGTAELGVCLPGCHSGGALCPSGACHARTDAAWHQGHCLGQPVACDPARQTGCGASQTCLVVAGPGIGGAARVCSAVGGAATVGTSCAAKACAEGLLCVASVCKKPCVPGGVGACASGVCADASAALGLAAGTVGLCP